MAFPKSTPRNKARSARSVPSSAPVSGPAAVASAPAAPLATDAQLAALLRAVRCERSFHPETDRGDYALLDAVLTELQSRRAADAAAAPLAAPAVSPAARFVLLRDGKVFAEHTREGAAKDHRDYMIATADGCEYSVVPASEVRP
jgi:hypothetical protein